MARAAFGRIAGCLLVLLAIGQAVAADESEFEPAAAEPITPIPQPPAVDPRRAALGEELFNDPRLSHDGARSCASCHDMGANGATANRRDKGASGLDLPFNTLTVFNAALSFRLNWEGKHRTLEDQLRDLLGNPDIMATTMPEIVGKLQASPATVQQFQEAYGHGPDGDAVIDALTTFERTLVTPDSRFDRWLKGDSDALNEQELAGYQLFKTLGCVACHQGVNVGGNLYQRHGIFSALASPNPVILRVPSLRNVAMTPPYFHDGSAATLQQAAQAMANAQLGRVLSPEQVDMIVAFLNSLTGRYRGRLLSPP